VAKPPSFPQPFTGFYRIACNVACRVEQKGAVREGVVWNVSTLGLYLVLPPPLPELGELLEVHFCLPGDQAEIAASAKVVWQNLPFVHGAGQKAPSLPPGCGLQFVTIPAAALQRIDARVRETYPGTHARPAGEGPDGVK
jgi:hypothetical protein